MHPSGKSRWTMSEKIKDPTETNIRAQAPLKEPVTEAIMAREPAITVIKAPKS